MFNKIILPLVLLSTLVSCTHSVHLVHVGDFKPYQKNTAGKKVAAKAEQEIFLGFTLETDYIEIARTNLISQCAKGAIQGPVTRISTSHGFFSWTNTVYIQGLCIL